MSTPRPEQPPPRPNPGGPLQPRPAASYAELARGQQTGVNPADDLKGSQQGGNSYHGWKPTKSPWPGYVGLVMVIIAVLVTTSVMSTMMQAAIPLIVSQVRHGVDPTVSPAMVQTVFNAFEQAAPDAAMLITASYWLGLAGVLLGLIGAIIGRGRGAGVLAIVLGIVSPALMATYIAFTIAPMITP